MRLEGRFAARRRERRPGRSRSPKLFQRDDPDGNGEGAAQLSQTIIIASGVNQQTRFSEILKLLADLVADVAVVGM
jgi:hypothetical protein